jgi:sugar phosphate isomerase/epimerase
LAPGAEPGWLSAAEQQLQLINEELAESGVSLLIRLATAPQFRGRSLKSWTAMEPQDWRDLLSVGEGVGLSFSPADCVWLGIDYLKVLPGIVSAIEHIEAHDIEISRDLLKDSGIYGPLWWRYRLPGKGQVDWTQLIEALKLYEFVVNEFDMLEDALDSSIKLFAPLVKDN